jgi:hypothetical protein
MTISVEPWTPPGDGEYVTEQIRKYERFIPKWVEHITVSYSESGEFVAEMSVSEEYRRATLSLGRKWACSFTDSDQSMTDLHDLMHLYTTPIAHKGKEAVRAFCKEEESPGFVLAWDSIDRAQERATEDLTRMVASQFN